MTRHDLDAKFLHFSLQPRVHAAYVSLVNSFFFLFEGTFPKKPRLENVKKLRAFEMSEFGVASGRVCTTSSVGS